MERDPKTCVELIRVVLRNADLLIVPCHGCSAREHCERVEAVLTTEPDADGDGSDDEA